MHTYSISTKPRSIGLLYLITKLSFWFSILFSLVLSSLLIYGTLGKNIPLKVTLETNDSIYEKDYSFNNKDVVIKKSKLTKEFPIQTLKRKLILKHQAFHLASIPEQITILFSTLLLLAIMMRTTYCSKEFMRAMNKGLYFERATIEKLRAISYLLLSAWFLNLLSSSILKFLWANPVVNPIAKIHLSTNFPSINLLVFSLMLWVLSYVFLQGVKLKEENELTV
jgi:hypothetical protein